MPWVCDSSISLARLTSKQRRLLSEVSGSRSPSSWASARFHLQLLDLRRGVLEVAPQIGGIALHLLVLGDQELHQRPHLVGLGERVHVPVRLGERFGIGVVGVHVGPHEPQDHGQLVVELDLRRLQRFGAILEPGRLRCDRPVAQGADARDAEADYSKQESSSKNDLERLPIAVSLRALGRPQPECQNLKTHRAAPRLPHRILELWRLKIGLIRSGNGPVESEISTEPEVAPACSREETGSPPPAKISAQLARNLDENYGLGACIGAKFSGRKSGCTHRHGRHRHPWRH